MQFSNIRIKVFWNGRRYGSKQTIILIYLDRKKGTDPDSIYDEDFIDYLGVGLFWFIAIPFLIFAYIANYIKTICVFVVETKIALETDEEEQEEDENELGKG